jgi:HEAT repeat protein
VKVRSALVVGFGALCAVLAAGTPDPHALASRLGDPSARRRDEAARELLGLGRDAAPALETASASSDPEIRSRARALLALVRDGDGAEIRARQADAAVREALRTDGGLDAGSACDVRVAALSPESGVVLAAAARRTAERGFVSRSFACALARHATPDTLAALAEFVRDERVFPSSALAAARELDRAIAASPESADGFRADAADALASLDAAMRSGHPATRRMAVALYGALAGDEAVARLVTAADADPGVRAETARVMGVHAAGLSAKTLRRLAGDASPDVRLAALTALLRVPGSPRPEPAVAAAGDESPAVRAAAARLLGREATPDTVGVLETLATDPSDRVRGAAREALTALR